MGHIQQAVSVLQSGCLVGMPTETVYGLAADARNETAIRKIFAAKNRPADHPLIVHIGDVALLSEWAREISADAMLLAQHFWPGPLTMILKKQSSVSNLITGNQDTIGIRMPNHPVALQLLRAFQGGVAAPSANKFGRISPTTASAVREELGDAVDLVLEGGQCEVGVESTIVDMTSDNPVILRPGMISADALQTVLQKPILTQQKNSPRVSGSHELHYAPRTPTYVLTQDKLLAEISANTEPLAVMAYEMQPIPVAHVTWKSLSSDPKQYAHDLYAVMRELDHGKFSKILIEAVPQSIAWDAIRDRLKRAGHL